MEWGSNGSAQPGHKYEIKWEGAGALPVHAVDVHDERSGVVGPVTLGTAASTDTTGVGHHFAL